MIEDARHGHTDGICAACADAARTLDAVRTDRDQARRLATFWYLANLADTRALTEPEEALYAAYADTRTVAGDGWAVGDPVHGGGA